MTVKCLICTSVITGRRRTVPGFFGSYMCMNRCPSLLDRYLNRKRMPWTPGEELLLEIVAELPMRERFLQYNTLARKHNYGYRTPAAIDAAIRGKGIDAEASGQFGKTTLAKLSRALGVDHDVVTRWRREQPIKVEKLSYRCVVVDLDSLRDLSRTKPWIFRVVPLPGLCWLFGDDTEAIDRILQSKTKTDPRPVEFEGRKYPSQSAAAKAIGVEPVTVSYAVRAGKLINGKKIKVAESYGVLR